MIDDRATEACDRLATVLEAARSGRGDRRRALAAAWANVSPVTSGNDDVDRQLAALDRQLTDVKAMSDTDIDSAITHLLAVHWRLAELRYG